jgi:hypothetical protein
MRSGEVVFRHVWHAEWGWRWARRVASASSGATSATSATSATGVTVGRSSLERRRDAAVSAEHEFADALARQPDDIKAVIEFAF